MNENETNTPKPSNHALPSTSATSWKGWVVTLAAVFATVLLLQLVRGHLRISKLREIGTTASLRFDSKFKAFTMSAVPKTNRDFAITLRMLSLDCSSTQSSIAMYESVAKQSIGFLHDTGELPEGTRIKVLILDRNARECHVVYDPPWPSSLTFP